MAENLADSKVYATFDKYEEFRSIQGSLLSVDLNASPSLEEERHEKLLLRKSSEILGEYQEQAYLLDPYLESVITPMMETFKAHAKHAVLDPTLRASPSRVGRITLLLYEAIKCRGYKTIVRFFPHEIADLSIALGYFQSANSLCHEPSQWSIRYVVLLWLSLICMLPFDLAQFDEVGYAGKAAHDIENLAKSFLSRAGLERDGAAMLLSHFYMRADTQSHFPTFLDWCYSEIQHSGDVFSCIGFLQVICAVVKFGSLEQVNRTMSIIHQIQEATATSALTNNTVVRKFRTKLISRVALRILPQNTRKIRQAKKLSTEGHDPCPNPATHDDIEVPEEVESILENILQDLQDKDTIVRWSAAKGIARISERLPAEFANQVLDTVMGLFAVHSIAGASIYDLPAIAEGTWHGSCLACAEMARRALIIPEKLPQLLEWMSKALYFDIRKGAHSIGSNVRDAAAYVLWALARVQDRAVFAPHAERLAQQLVTVALYDREVHIRGAASAAFQEHVGRMNLFPHGIDILREIDFYAVSIRRHAFLVAAREVSEHPAYRQSLFDHLLDVTQRHWDISMRELGAQSLRIICELDLPNMAPRAVQRAMRLLDSLDVTDVHGALMVLKELAAAYRDSNQKEQSEPYRFEIFGSLSRIPFDTLKASRNHIIITAACNLIANAITYVEIEQEAITPAPRWRQIVDLGLRHSMEPVQMAAALAMASISRLVDCSVVINRLKTESVNGQLSLQKSVGFVLGTLDYTAHGHDLTDTIAFLLDRVRSSPAQFVNVEARRNCYHAIGKILETVAPQISKYLSSDTVRDIIYALQQGLKDYTMDERGDVGSWIRTVCVTRLTSIFSLLFMNAAAITKFEDYLPPALYHDAVGGILKQGVERLDGVREVSGQCFLRLLQNEAPVVQSRELWQIHGYALMKNLFLNDEEIVGWRDATWLYPRAVRLLEVETYRSQILSGLVLSVGSRTDSTQRPAAINVVSYAQSLPLTSSGTGYNLSQLVKDLLDHARSHTTSNAVFIPVLQTFSVFLDANVLKRLMDIDQGLQSLHSLLELASRNIDRIKNIQRIHESMKIVVNLLEYAPLFSDCVPVVAQFLSHQYPKIRSDTAEYLYITLQSKDIGRETDEAEVLLLDTEWSSTDLSVPLKAARAFVDAILGKLGSEIGL